MITKTKFSATDAYIEREREREREGWLEGDTVPLPNLVRQMHS